MGTLRKESSDPKQSSSTLIIKSSVTISMLLAWWRRTKSLRGNCFKKIWRLPKRINLFASWKQSSKSLCQWRRKKRRKHIRYCFRKINKLKVLSSKRSGNLSKLTFMYKHLNIFLLSNLIPSSPFLKQKSIIS